MMFPSTYLGFDIWNPKLFASKNRLSIVPSLQSIKLAQFSNYSHINEDIIFENVDRIFLPVLQYVKNALNSMVRSVLHKTYKNYKLLKFFMLTFFYMFYMFGSAA